MSIWTPEEARKFAINCIMEASSYEQSDAEEIVNSIAAMKRREAESVPVAKGDERERPNHCVHRGYEWTPCWCAANRDHQIGDEVTSPPSQPSTGVPEGLDERSSVPSNRPNLYAAGWNDYRALILAAAPRSP